MLFAAPHPVGAAPWAAADGSRAAETARLARARRMRGAHGRPCLGWGWRAAVAPSCITSSSMRCVSRRPRRLPHMRVRMVCRRRVYVPRAHDRVRSLRLPTSRGARPCCGRRLEGSRLEARDPRRLPHSHLSYSTLRSSPLSSGRYLEEASKADQLRRSDAPHRVRPRRGRWGRRRRLSTR